MSKIFTAIVSVHVYCTAFANQTLSGTGSANGGAPDEASAWVVTAVVTMADAGMASTVHSIAANNQLFVQHVNHKL